MIRLRMKALVATILLLTGSLMAMAEDICVQDQDGVVYSLDETTMTAMVYDGSEVSGDIEVYDYVEYEGKRYDVTSIDEYAFYRNSKLTSIEIPNSVKSIGRDAFCFCLSLASANIPEGMTDIGDNAFYSCMKLTSIEIPSSVTSIGRHAFDGCSFTSLEIPGSVVSIGEYAFYKCKGLTSLKLNEGLKTIGKSAFGDCNKLESIYIPSSVEALDGLSFSGNALKSIQVDEGNKVYDSRNNCNAIVETATNTLITGSNTSTIPDGIEGIGKQAFISCQKITSLNIPASVTSIGDEAFAGCGSLTSVSIPASVTSIGANPFVACTKINDIQVDGANKAYDSRENCNAIIETATNKLITGCINSTIPHGVTAIGAKAFYWQDIADIDIPSTVNSIGKEAFSGCKNLTSVKIPDGVTTLEYNVFFGCDGLTSVEIPSSVTRIEESAFYYCEALESITIPASVTFIDDFAFSNCASLKNVYLYGTEIRDCFEYTFNNIPEDAVLHVDASVVDQYKAAEFWSDSFASIVPLETTGIENIHADGNGGPCRVYSVDGKLQTAKQKGINILRYKNGKTIKMMQK